MNNVHLFISHSWKYNNEYEKLIKLLEDRGYFNFADYSVPKTDPLYIKRGSDYEKILREGIENQMRSCSILLVIAGKWVSFSDSILMELEIANKMGKAIIAIRPYGAAQTSSRAELYADEIVNWNSDSIVEAIRKHS